jgi:radical SAM protein with 4Fe4S-binding SPASM domain
MTSLQRYVRLAGHVSLRLLEEPCLYDRRADELYELNLDAMEGLKRCHGGLTLEQAELESEFASFCLAEGILELSDDPRPHPLPLCQGPVPSLRYLEAQVTWRCNLACNHCYLGKARSVDMEVNAFAGLVREFEAMGGLRLLISGGEPLMHPRWDEINAALAGLPLRRVLLSNGLLLDEKRLARLNCDEVQISLDGLQAGHECLRGKGSFALALEAARRVAEAGLKLSIATMAHARNLEEMDGLAELVQDLGAEEWGVDAPCIAGRLTETPDLALSPRQAAAAMEHAFGGAYHGGSGGMACGLHLCTVAADGKLAQCGFYFDSALGHMAEGLWTCWDRREPLALSQVPDCLACQAAEDCGGGCRFRAPALDRPDPVMCALYGVNN